MGILVKLYVSWTFHNEGFFNPTQSHSVLMMETLVKTNKDVENPSENPPFVDHFPRPLLNCQVFGLRPCVFMSRRRRQGIFFPPDSREVYSWENQHHQLIGGCSIAIFHHISWAGGYAQFAVTCWQMLKLPWFWRLVAHSFLSLGKNRRMLWHWRPPWAFAPLGLWSSSGFGSVTGE